MLSSGLKSGLKTVKLHQSLGNSTPKKGSFGVELEIEGVELPLRIEGWAVHNEGSLRGHAREYVTAGAFDREHLSVLLDVLTSTFQAYGSRPRFSYRAGTHIHKNMQTRTPDSIIRSIILWCIVEPLFLKLCGPNRDGNLFCLSAYDTGEMHIWLRNVFREYQENQNHHRVFLQRGKYASLNVDQLYGFGTLEVRALANSWDKNEILRWCDYIDAILKDHEMHPNEMIRQADTEPENFLRKIFGDLELPGNRISLLGFGIEQAFPLADIYSEYMGET